MILVCYGAGGGVEREVVVEVEWRCGEKAWLGGLRHKISGRHYHHAATQTSHLTRPPPGQSHSHTYKHTRISLSSIASPFITILIFCCCYCLLLLYIFLFVLLCSSPLRTCVSIFSVTSLPSSLLPSSPDDAGDTNGGDNISWVPDSTLHTHPDLILPPSPHPGTVITSTPYPHTQTVLSCLHLRYYQGENTYEYTDLFMQFAYDILHAILILPR